MQAGGPFDWFFNLFRGGALDPSGEFAWVLMGGTLLIVLLVGFLLFRRLLAKKSPRIDPELPLRENLADYPVAPANPGGKRLTVAGQSARLRLVVVAALGQQAGVNEDEVERYLDQVVPGLGAKAKQDRPRVRVWPPQLSHRGFAPNFHRLVSRPEPDGELSRWVLLAGPTRVGKFQVLLGLALHADEANAVGRLTLEPQQWGETLRFE
jgi:hypothetical protein